MKLGQSPEQRALFAAAREVRREPTPNPDWDALEESLLKRTRAGAAAVPVRRGRPWLLLLAPVAAVAAAFALFALREAPRASSVPAAHDHAALDGDELRQDQVLTTKERPLRVVHAGRAEWSLGPNTRAAVLEHAGVIRIRLEAGTLDAEVVPSPEPERFVVEAKGLRVAVHGTRFRVELREDRCRIEVEEGVVSVQPRARADLRAVLLRASSREEFTLDGGLLKGAAPQARPGSKGSPRSQPPSARTSSDATIPLLEESSPLTIGKVESGVTSVVDAVSRCFRDNTEEASDVKISLRTSVSFEVALDGSVSSVSFDPPLSPSVQVCSEEKVQAVRFAASSDGAHVTRVLELSR